MTLRWTWPWDRAASRSRKRQEHASFLVRGYSLGRGDEALPAPRFGPCEVHSGHLTVETLRR